MEPMKSRMKRTFRPPTNNKNPFDGRSNIKVEDMEIRPGGMLVQKRNSNSNQINPVPIPTIKVKVKYGSSTHQICISSQASFGQLKKILAEHTGVHHQDQKLIYKKKERDSKDYLDIVGVKDGSKIRLIEDITSRERRCLEMLKSAHLEKVSKSLKQINLEVDKLSVKVIALEATKSRGEKVEESDVDSLIEMLMNKLVLLDGIVAEGDLKLQKGVQEKRVQKYIETLDMLKLQKSKENRKESQIPMQKQENSTGKMPILMQKKPVSTKQKKETEQMPLQQQQQHQKQKILRHSETFVITTKWETFD
ncbi:hypothetical protein JCGZ_20664 [Jatropha curcas]|uniref:Ubiquitin-like domain-containing protein n=1 Tax=Jatropha curcas TaxID=180498 RepID=A0A067JRQ0_JATCU|nr:hypothetical protein JCGZ_20664 [Jatropha curcas]